MKRVDEIMIPLHRYPHVPASFSIEQAIEEMERTEIEFDGRKSLPRILLIFDELNNLQGMVRRRDIIKALEPQFLAETPVAHSRKLFNVKVDPNLSELVYDKVAKHIKNHAQQPIGLIAKPIAATIDYSDHVLKAATEMASFDISLLPVMKLKEVIGVVRSVEVFRELALLLREQQGPPLPA